MSVSQKLLKEASKFVRMNDNLVTFAVLQFRCAFVLFVLCIKY